MPMDSCVPAETHQNVVDPVDTLELDAADSDAGDVGDDSFATVMAVPTRSPPSTNKSESQSASTAKEDELNDVSAKSVTPSRKDEPVEKSASLEKPVNRRRQWGSSNRKDSKSTVEKLIPTPTTTEKTEETVAESADSVQDMEIKKSSKTSMMNGEVTAPIESHRETQDPRTKSKRRSGPLDTDKQHLHVGSGEGDGEKDSRERGTRESISEDASETTQKPSPKRKGPKETKAVGYLVEAPQRIQPAESAKHCPTDIVYIRSLVRPFTADQLRQMVTENYGPVVDLWLDRIKSSSIVQLASVETANKCREGLDGSRWPSMNPRTLRCDFSNKELFAWLKEHGNSDRQPPKHLLEGEPVAEVSNSSSKEVKKDKKDNAKPTPAEKPIETHKTLDELFRKTSQIPCVYWLPLTEEESQKQSTERAKILASKRSIVPSCLSSRPARPSQRETRSPFADPAVSTEPTNVVLPPPPPPPPSSSTKTTDSVKPAAAAAPAAAAESKPIANAKQPKQQQQPSKSPITEQAEPNRRRPVNVDKSSSKRRKLSSSCSSSSSSSASSSSSSSPSPAIKKSRDTTGGELRKRDVSPIPSDKRDQVNRAHRSSPPTKRPIRVSRSRSHSSPRRLNRPTRKFSQSSRDRSSPPRNFIRNRFRGRPNMRSPPSRRSPSPGFRFRFRSRSPARRSSPGKRFRSRSPVGRVRSRSPVKRVRSRSPVGHIRSRSPVGRVRSRSPVGRIRSRSPVGRVRSRSPVGRIRSRSPVGRVRSRSRSPVRRRPLSPPSRRTRR